VIGAIKRIKRERGSRERERFKRERDSRERQTLWIFGTFKLVFDGIESGVDRARVILDEEREEIFGEGKVVAFGFDSLWVPSGGQRFDDDVSDNPIQDGDDAIAVLNSVGLCLKRLGEQRDRSKQKTQRGSREDSERKRIQRGRGRKREKERQTRIQSSEKVMKEERD